MVRCRMWFTGKVKNGAIVPDEPLNLPDGTVVNVYPMMPLSPEFLKFAGCMEGSYPADYAARFDEYKRGRGKV